MIRGLPSLLLVLVVATHYSYDLIADGYANKPVAAQNWFYVLRGIEGALLYCVVWALTPLRPVSARLAVSVVCAWGALEETQTAVCRLAIGGMDGLPSPGQFRGLCDVVTGWPVYMATMVAVLLICALNYTKKEQP